MLEFFVLLHDVVVVKDSETELVLEHLRLQVLKHHVRHRKLLVCRHVLSVGQLSVERHDGSKGITFWNETKLAWCKVVIVAVTVHFGLLYCLQVVF